jgi:hypothetical protein
MLVVITSAEMVAKLSSKVMMATYLWKIAYWMLLQNDG